MAKQKFTFHENCVFLDEVGFDVYMRRSRGWAQRSKPAIEETTSARSVSHTVISAVSPFGIVNVSMRELGNVKKRRVVGAKKEKSTRECCCCYTKRNYSWPFCAIH